MNAMSSRLSYLAKYLDNPNDEKKKKKKKREKSPHKKSTVVVEKSHIFDDVPDNDNTENLEDVPVKVDVPGSKEFKGFKRIDNKDIKVEEAPISDTLEEPIQKTIYRDLTGKRINLDEKRKELEEKRASEERKKAEENNINIGEADIIEQQKLETKSKNIDTFSVGKNDKEYNDRMKKVERMEDPIVSFQHKAFSNDNSTSTGRYTYNKGINPTNRFNIKAGYFWDGIDRSNGFETKIVTKRQHQSMQKLQTAVDETYDLDLD